MTIEYVIHHGDEIGEDLDFIDGKNWREAKKLIARCKTDNGIKVNSGVYFYLIKAGIFVRTKKMVLLN